MVRSHPRALGLRGALAPEKLLAVGQPIQRVNRTVVRGEVKLVALRLEFGRSQNRGRSSAETSRGGRHWERGERRGGGPWWSRAECRHRPEAGAGNEGPVDAPIEGARRGNAPMAEPRGDVRQQGDRRVRRSVGVDRRRGSRQPRWEWRWRGGKPDVLDRNALGPRIGWWRQQLLGRWRRQQLLGRRWRQQLLGCRRRRGVRS